MMKSITPVISIILLILITIIASSSAFFFVNSNVLDLESQGSADTFPGMDNSRLNLVSVTGSKVILRNDGTSPVTEIVMFVNDELLNFTLASPIMPGELMEINYSARGLGEDLEIKVIYNQGKVAQASSPAIKNTEVSGFTETPGGLNDEPATQFFTQCAANSIIANLDNNRVLTQSSNITCGCIGDYGENFIINGDFENGTWGWAEGGAEESEIIDIDGNHVFAFSEDGQDILPADSLSFMLNYSEEESYGIIILVLNKSFNEYYDDEIIFGYLMTNNLMFSSWCNSLVESGFYLKCFEANPSSWQNISFDLKQDFLKYSGINIYDFETIKIQFQNMFSTYAVVDNVSLKYSTNRKYCDSFNDGVLDGVCSQESCDKLIIDSITPANYAFIYSPAFFNASINYFDEPDSCTITIEEEEHSMLNVEDNYYYSGLFNQGNITGAGEVKCTSSGEGYFKLFNYSFLADRYSGLNILDESYYTSRKVLCSGNDSYFFFSNQDNDFYIINSSNRGLNLSDSLNLFNNVNSDSVKYSFNNDSIFVSYYNIDLSTLLLFNISRETMEFENFMNLTNIFAQKIIAHENELILVQQNDSGIFFINISLDTLDYEIYHFSDNLYLFDVLYEGGEYYLIFDYNHNLINITKTTDFITNESFFSLQDLTGEMFNNVKFSLNNDYLFLLHNYKGGGDDYYYYRISRNDMSNHSLVFSFKYDSIIADGNNVYLVPTADNEYFVLKESNDNGYSFTEKRLADGYFKSVEYCIDGENRVFLTGSGMSPFGYAYYR